jgi:hypothetical protein
VIARESDGADEARGVLQVVADQVVKGWVAGRARMEPTVTSTYIRQSLRGRSPHCVASPGSWFPQQSRIIPR